MAWPCRPESWLNGFDTARTAFAAVVCAIALFEPVSLLVRAEDFAEAQRLTLGAASLIEAELDDSWTRDTGPTFLIEDDGGLLRAALGVETIIWLPRGLSNDETLGHIDNIRRFCAPGHVLLPVTSDAGDPDHRILAEARAVLGSVRDARGDALTITALPMPPRRLDPN